MGRGRRGGRSEDKRRDERGNVREEREEAMNKGNDAQAVGDPH